MEKFIHQIMSNLENNGYPSKKVSLPTEKMYEIADSKGLSFNTVIDSMKERYSMNITIGEDKIIFEEKSIDENLESFDGLDQKDMMAKAQEMMSKMDPKELERIKDMFMNMSEDEKEDLMKKGKDLGLV